MSSPSTLPPQEPEPVVSLRCDSCPNNDEISEPATDEEVTAFCQTILEPLRKRQVIPFLGAGINLCSICDEDAAQPYECLPDGRGLKLELHKLAAKCNCGKMPPHDAGTCPNNPYPFDKNPSDLTKVAEAALLNVGEFDFVNDLYSQLKGKGAPTRIHDLLAKALKGHIPGEAKLPPLLIVTTNYDDVLERALERENVQFDVLAYHRKNSESESSYRHWFKAKWNPDAVTKSDEREQQRAKNPDSWIHNDLVVRTSDPKNANLVDQYQCLPIQNHSDLTHTIILKIHGDLNPDSADESTFVITERDYIQFLAQMNPESPVPKQLHPCLSNKRFLFMGYSLGDWNMQVLLHLLKMESRRDIKHWSVMKSIRSVDKLLWAKGENVRFLIADLDKFAAKMGALL